jgi:pimeloyl-ACP methyl ester carboxylesterase
MDARAALSRTTVPVAIIAAADDTLIRPARTNALRRAVPRLSYDRTIAAAGHNDIYHHSAFHDAMRKALTTLTS